MKKLDIIIKASENGIKIPDDYKQTFLDLIKYCNEKRGGFMRLILSPPFKHRSTGPLSQGNHINGHVHQIANRTGEDFDVIKMHAKRSAIKRGYPIRDDLFGDVQPLSETEIDSEQAGFLIEELHMIADFLGIKLRED